jgi:uncharacterized RDD family membrane protein YckC
MERLYGTPICKRCYTGYISRRQWGYFLDSLIVFAVVNATVWGYVFPSAGTASGNATTDVRGALVVTLLGLFMTLGALGRDAIWGHSPGRALVGLQVVYRTSRRPIGFRASVKRNLGLLFQPTCILAAWQSLSGYRIGDNWAGTQVTWRKYEGKGPFVPPTATDQGGRVVMGSGTGRGAMSNSV